MIAAAITIAVAILLPVPLERLPAEQAAALAGQVRTFTFVVTPPPWTYRGATVIGAAAGLDGAEQTVVIRGVRYEVDVGRRVNVTGNVRVIEHAADAVLGVPRWTEIRVDSTR